MKSGDRNWLEAKHSDGKKFIKKRIWQGLSS